MKRRLFFIVAIGVLGNLCYTWLNTDFDQLKHLSQFQFEYLLLALCFALLPWFWHSIRLRIWSKFLGKEISFKNIFRIVVATDLGAAVTPTMIGGAPIKLGMLVQQGLNTGQATTLIALASFEDILFFTLLIPLSLLFTRTQISYLFQSFSIDFQPSLFSITIIVLLISLVLWSLFIRRKRSTGPKWIMQVRAKVAKIKSDFLNTASLIYRGGQRQFIFSFLALCLQWLSRFTILGFIVLSLGLEVHWIAIFFLQWMIFVAMSLTPTPGATGGAEAAFLLVFGKIIPQNAIGVLLIGWRFATYYFILLTAWLWLVINPPVAR